MRECRAVEEDLQSVGRQVVVMAVFRRYDYVVMIMQKLCFHRVISMVLQGGRIGIAEWFGRYQSGIRCVLRTLAYCCVSGCDGR